MLNMKHCKEKPKVILVPYPAQGHVTPMLKLASLFLNYGYESTVVLPAFIHNKIVLQIEPANQIQLVCIPDGWENVTAPDFFAIETAMENSMPSHFDALVQESREGGGLFCVVVDMLASWAIEVARKYDGLPIAGFWPAMLASYRLISAIPDMVCSGLISEAGIPHHVDESFKLPDQPKLSTIDLPWLIGTLSSKKARFKFWTRVLRRSKSVRFLLVNSFEDEYHINKSQVQLMINNGSHNNGHIEYPIGPLCKHAITNNTISFWEEDTSCLHWLNKQKPESVVYVSFGSWVSPIGERKLRSLALALEASSMPFIWVLRSDWHKGLPSGFLERVSQQGKVVLWAPQMEVLGHKAVGCYLTHCGWNSTVEAIQCQKRLLCYPVAGDQFVNCTYMVKVWRIGLKLNGFSQKDIEEGLRSVMEDYEIRKKVMGLYERLNGEKALEKDVSNLKAFVDDIKREQLRLSPSSIDFKILNA